MSETADTAGPTLAASLRLTAVALQDAVTSLVEGEESFPMSPASVERALRAVADLDDVEPTPVVGMDSGHADSSATRQALSEVHIACEAQALAELAREVARVASSLRAPVPDRLLAIVRQMSEVCVDAVGRTADALEHRGIPALRLPVPYDEVGRLQQSLLAACVDEVELQVAFAVTLVGRFFVRFADHTAAVVHHVRLLATATNPG